MSAAACSAPVRAAGAAIVRVGVPEPGGRLVDVAREAHLPVMFSANAFMRRDARGAICSVRFPDHAMFAGLDAALDSAGYVAASQYHGYPWSIDQYLDLVESFDWAWYASMDHCAEPEIAGDRVSVMFRMAETCRSHALLLNAARRRGLPDPVPVLQGWSPSDYLWCVDHYPVERWPDLVGVGSMCRRQLAGPDGVLAVLDALDAVLPAHTRLHLYGLKGAALGVVGQHPRICSVDSMAWDYAARRDHPTGRTQEMRARYMLTWAKRNQGAAGGYQLGYTGSLFQPEAEQPDPHLDRWIGAVLDNDMCAADAYQHYMRLGCDYDALEELD